MHPWRYTSAWHAPSPGISWGVDVVPWPLDPPPPFGQFFLTCVPAIPGNGFSRVWTSYDIWRLPLPPLFFWFFFWISFWLISICGNLKPVWALLIFTVQNPVASSFRSHWVKVSNGSSGGGQGYRSPKQLSTLCRPTAPQTRRTTPAGTFSAAASESQSGTAHSQPSFPHRSIYSPVKLAGSLYQLLLTTWHIYDFFFLKKKQKTNVSKNNFMTIIKIFISSLCK